MSVAARRYANPDTLGVVAAPHTPSEVTVARILLAEDDPDIRHPVVFTLGRADLHVDAFSDGFTALGAAQLEPSDLAVLDVRMPLMSGLELCRELRAHPSTAKIPIIGMTARNRPQDVEIAYQGGTDDYVVKPSSPRDLLHRVEAALAKVTT